MSKLLLLYVVVFFIVFCTKKIEHKNSDSDHNITIDQNNIVDQNLNKTSCSGEYEVLSDWEKNISIAVENTDQHRDYIKQTLSTLPSGLQKKFIDQKTQIRIDNEILSKCISDNSLSQNLSGSEIYFSSCWVLKDFDNQMSPFIYIKVDEDNSYDYGKDMLETLLKLQAEFIETQIFNNTDESIEGLENEDNFYSSDVNDFESNLLALTILFDRFTPGSPALSLGTAIYIDLFSDYLCNETTKSDISLAYDSIESTIFKPLISSYQNDPVLQLTNYTAQLADVFYNFSHNAEVVQKQATKIDYPQPTNRNISYISKMSETKITEGLNSNVSVSQKTTALPDDYGNWKKDNTLPVKKRSDLTQEIEFFNTSGYLKKDFPEGYSKVPSMDMGKGAYYDGIDGQCCRIIMSDDVAPQAIPDNGLGQKKPINIMLHGTFYAHGPSRWGDPENVWSKSISREYGGETVAFQWSARNTDKARQEAGEALAKKITSLQEQGYDVNLIGHSHGNNVINHALSELKEGTKIGEYVSLARPIRDDYPLDRLKVRSYVEGVGSQDAVQMLGGKNYSSSALDDSEIANTSVVIQTGGHNEPKKQAVDVIRIAKANRMGGKYDLEILSKGLDKTNPNPCIGKCLFRSSSKVFLAVSTGVVTAGIAIACLVNPSLKECQNIENIENIE